MKVLWQGHGAYESQHFSAPLLRILSREQSVTVKAIVIHMGIFLSFALALKGDMRGCVCFQLFNPARTLHRADNLQNNKTTSENSLSRIDPDKQIFRDERIILCSIFSLTLLATCTTKFMFISFISPLLLSAFIHHDGRILIAALLINPTEVVVILSF